MHLRWQCQMARTGVSSLVPRSRPLRPAPSSAREPSHQLSTLASLPAPPQLGGEPQALFNAVSLAYLGDAIWEALVRRHVWCELISGPRAVKTRTGPSPRDLQSAAANWANASKQAELHDLMVSASQPASTASVPTSTGTNGLTDIISRTTQADSDSQATASFHLNEAELDLLRWARNSSAVKPPANVDSLAYKKATALEVLVAHLYLTNPERCVALVSHLLSRGPQVKGKAQKTTRS